MFLRVALCRLNVFRRVINFTPIAVRVQGYNRYNGNYQNKGCKHGRTLATVLLSSVILSSTKEKEEKAEETETYNTGPNLEKNIEAGLKRPDLPTYTAEEVNKHDGKESFWVTYKHGVYDVTKFLTSHPGGEQIFNAAGLSIEPFWNVYGMHHTPEVYRLLETYRIGNLHDDDVVDHSEEELWAREPRRDGRLIIRTAKPFNAEIPPNQQIAHFDTPNELFYVRQHMPVPELDAASHRLRVIVRGPETIEKEFSLEELQQFPVVELRAALMCAGNRRSEMNKATKPVKGISWATGAISNAVWRGVLLRDVLVHCGVDLEDTEGKHIIFTGSDIDATGENFSTSIPLHMAANPSARIVLATHMNGAPLPPDHGHPLRVVVPGAPAVRSVKWLESITISKDESSSHWHQKDYRAFNPSKTWETLDFSTAPPMYSLPVTSAICDPQDDDEVVLRDGHLEVKGYAYSGGGAKVLRVDLSLDRGATWTEAELVASDDAPPQQHYSWTLWRASLPVTPDQQELELWAKATDSNFNTQPERFDHIWNVRGLLSNAYHRIKLRVRPPVDSR